MRVNFTICRKRYCIATRICHESGPRVHWHPALDMALARSLNPTINLCERVRVESGNERVSVFLCVLFFRSLCARNKCTMTWKVNSVFRSTLVHYLFLSAGCYRRSAIVRVAALRSAQVVCECVCVYVFVWYSFANFVFNHVVLPVLVCSFANRTFLTGSQSFVIQKPRDTNTFQVNCCD